MPEARKTARLLPCGLVVDDVTVGPDEVVIAAHALGRSAECPGCGRLSRRVHGRCERYLSDVPAHGRRVRARLSTRRFRCPHRGCARKIAHSDASGIEIVSRDRGGGYGSAVSRLLPGARQVADRWHLLANASRAVVDAVRRCHGDIRRTSTANEISPELLTAAERVRYEGVLRRQETNAAVQALAAEGVAIKRQVRRTARSRQVVRRILRGAREDIFRLRRSSLEPWLPRLDAEWTAGCRTGAEFRRRLCAAGDQGSLRVVTEWATRRRRAETAPGNAPPPAPSRER